MFELFEALEGGDESQENVLRMFIAAIVFWSFGNCNICSVLVGHGGICSGLQRSQLNLFFEAFRTKKIGEKQDLNALKTTEFNLICFNFLLLILMFYHFASFLEFVYFYFFSQFVFLLFDPSN